MKGDPSKPLHLCNLYGSKEAGAKLGEMLKMGKSKPWKEAMEVMTGQPDMSTDAIREYFLPLEKWLKKENKKNGVRVGWDHDDSKVMCSDQTSGQTTDQTSSSETTDQTSGEITTDETPGETTDLTGKINKFPISVHPQLY